MLLHAAPLLHAHGDHAAAYFEAADVGVMVLIALVVAGVFYFRNAVRKLALKRAKDDHMMIGRL